MSPPSSLAEWGILCLQFTYSKVQKIVKDISVLHPGQQSKDYPNTIADVINGREITNRSYCCTKNNIKLNKKHIKEKYF